MSATRSEMEQMFGQDLLFMDGYDTAICGVVVRFGQLPIVCYDLDTVIQTNTDMGMTEEESVEFFEYNQLGAGMGELTPCFLIRK